MSPTIIPPLEDKCEKCDRCVEIAITSDPQGFNAPSRVSDCSTNGCPINAKYKPNAEQSMMIYFVSCNEAGA